VIGPNLVGVMRLPRQSTGITGRTSTKEDAVATAAVFQLPPVAQATRRHGKVDRMKTIAIRLEDEMSELLGLVAQLEGTSQIDQIRDAITSHLERKIAGGDLTARAQEALDEVEREASAKRKAIEQLVSNVADTVRTTKCHLPALRDHPVASIMGPRRVHFDRLRR
jgi:predicted DNA-binding protein